MWRITWEVLFVIFTYSSSRTLSAISRQTKIYFMLIIKSFEECVMIYLNDEVLHICINYFSLNQVEPCTPIFFCLVRVVNEKFPWKNFSHKKNFLIEFSRACLTSKSNPCSFSTRSLWKYSIWHWRLSIAIAHHELLVLLFHIVQAES